MNINFTAGSLIISEVVINVFVKHLQLEDDSPESGGIVTGKLYDNLIEILSCSEPTNFDRRSRFNFTRSYKSAQSFIDEKFVNSKGQEIYLGEWHTHPEDYPSPSILDVKSFENTLKKNNLNSNIHFMIIVGRIDIYLGVYVGKKKKEELHFSIKRGNG